MPIQTQIEKRFSKDILKKIVHAHRWAIFLGLVLPAMIFLFAVIFTGELFGTWPSVLSQVYEQVILFGWAGVYIFAMLFIIYPELNDLRGEKEKNLALALNMYSVGVAALVFGVILWLFTKQYALFALPIFLGTALQIMGWFSAMNGFFAVLRKKKRFSAFDQLIAIGIIPFTFALIALFIAYLSLFLSGETLFSLEFRIGFRFLPMAGIGLILLAMLIRMSPEMLNWRPLDEQKLRNIYAYLLVATSVLASGYGWFHFTYQQPGTFVYALGAFALFGGLIWLFSSLDLWMVKLLKGDTEEHVPFLYVALTGLVITITALLFFVGWEVTRGVALSLFWANSFAHLFFLGFVVNGILSMFLYVNNQIEGVYTLKSKIPSIVFALLFWIVVLRVLVLPLMLVFGWPGFITFQWALDGLLYFAVFLLSFTLLAHLSMKFKR